MRLSLYFVTLVTFIAATAGAQLPSSGNDRPSSGMMSVQDPKMAVAKLAKLEKQYKRAKAEYTKRPKKEVLKKRYIDATVVYGHESMISSALPNKVKYRQALLLYKEALKLDPNNPVAKPESELMIRIYKSMGKPVPE